jgi:hypothetical protein
MGIQKLIGLAAALAVLAASTGQLLRIIMAVRIAQLQLFKESQTSKWGKVMLLR